MLLLLVSVAHATCFYDSLETRVDARDGGFVRRDRWSIYVETGRVECATLPFEDEGGTLEELRAVIRHPDERTRRPDLDERWEVLAPDERRLHPGFVLHLPELRFGDTLELEVVRKYATPALTWRPAAWGPVAKARLDWSTGSPVLKGAPEPAGDWIFTDAHDLVATFGSPPVDPLASVVASDIEVRWIVEPDLSRRVEETKAARLEPGGRLVIASPRDARCDATSGDVLHLAGGCAVVGEGDVTLRAAWTIAAPAIGGEVSMRGSVPVRAFRFEVQSPLGEVVPGAVEASNLAPVTPEGVSEAFSWRVARHDGTDVLTDRATAVSMVAYRAVLASFPEPGLPVGLKGTTLDLPGIGDIVALVHAQVRPGRLPEENPISPRRLTRVRRSGFASPWESALLLTRYLQQARAEVVPMMVRSPQHGPADPFDPWSYGDGAVVRVRVDDKDVWIDPSCTVCALGEIDPDSWGGDVLDATLASLPASPGGTATFRYEGGALVATFTGTAALRFRQALADVRQADRAAWLATTLGGGTATKVTGLEPGAALQIEVDGVQRMEPIADWSIARDGEAKVRLPVEGTREIVIEGGTASSARVERAGLVYTRTADTERLEIADPIISRADALAFLAEVAATR